MAKNTRSSEFTQLKACPNNSLHKLRRKIARDATPWRGPRKLSCAPSGSPFRNEGYAHAAPPVAGILIGMSGPNIGTMKEQAAALGMSHLL